jgi:hypothetical protein
MTELMQVIKVRHSVSEIERTNNLINKKKKKKKKKKKAVKTPPRGFKAVAFFNVEDRDTSSYHHVKTWGPCLCQESDWPKNI